MNVQVKQKNKLFFLKYIQEDLNNTKDNRLNELKSIIKWIKKVKKTNIQKNDKIAYNL